jgi:hypothetical protein
MKETTNPRMGGKRSGSGRKAVNINLAELEKLSMIQCTDQEIACFFEVDVRTIERRKKKPAFAAALERGRAKGRVSVRRMLFAQAAKGNVAASIFLAKNVLGYKDHRSNEHSGPEGGPIPVSVVAQIQARRNHLARRKQLDAATGAESPTSPVSGSSERPV